MNKTFNNDLSLLPWTNTKAALENLQEFLKCNACHELPTSPVYMGRCDHFFCDSCIMNLTDSFCPVCKIPSPPCERKPDIVVRGLVSSVTEMFTLINGGEIKINKNIEAPEPSSHRRFSSNTSSSSKVPFTTRSATNKENVMEIANSAVPTSSAPNHIQTLNHVFEKNKPKEKLPKAPKKCTKKVTEPNVKTESKSILNSHDKRATSQLCLSKVEPSKMDEPPVTPKHLPSSKPKDLSVLGATPVTPAINKRNMRGETPLHIACIKPDVVKVKRLLQDGANPNTKDNAGWTPLHEACSHAFEEVAALLLEHGALVDVPGSNNMTPLHDAVITETIPVISILRQWGASDVIRDIWGRSARTLADYAKNPNAVHSALNIAQDPMLVPNKMFGALQNKIVILESNLNLDYKKKLEKLSKLLKVKLVNDFSSDVTHVVVGCEEEHRVCRRTIKFMTGVVSGKWIVSHKWIDACLSVEGPVNPVDFEVEGLLSNPCSLAPNKGRRNFSKLLPGLFSGCHLYFYGPYGGNLPTKKELESLVKAGDGTSLQREPNPESIPTPDQTVPYHSPLGGVLSKCSHFCIYTTGPQEPQLKYDMVHIKSLPLSWLYDCIDQWAIISP